MKANLPASEPATIARWDALGLHDRIREPRRGAPKFVLHDGPPYANGDDPHRARDEQDSEGPHRQVADHGGLRRAVRAGLGLPRPADRAQRRAREGRAGQGPRAGGVPPRLPRLCREVRRLAARGLQAARHPRRLGRAVLTMAPAYQAAIVRALGKFVARGLVYKGKKPVYWCLRDRTALAEAEVEYETHTSPSIYVEFPLSPATRGDAGRAAAGARPAATSRRSSGRRRRGRFRPIWRSRSIRTSTTARTRPRRRGQPASIVAEALAERVAAATGKTVRREARVVQGRACSSACASGIRSTTATRSAVLARVRHARAGHRRRAHGARAWRRRLRAPASATDSTSTRRSAQRPVQRRRRRGRRPQGLRGQPGGGGRARASAAGSGSRASVAAFVSALLALPSAGDLPGDAAVVHQHGRRCATARWPRPTPCAWIPDWGRERMTGMFVARPDWCISRQRAWGVPIPALACNGVRRRRS